MYINILTIVFNEAWYKHSASYKGHLIGVHRPDFLHGVLVNIQDTEPRYPSSNLPVN